MNASPTHAQIIVLQPGHKGRALLALTLVAALTALPALSQPIYRIVGPDGRVSYSDQPPPPTVPAKATPLASTGTAGADAIAALPFELRQAASRYPVTLYTTANCSPCDSGRAYLSGRGVPFTEKTIASFEDNRALTRLSGDGSLPLLTVGAQQLKGFSSVEWAQYLDAAGYPKTSALPPTWRNAPATPLVEVKRPEPGSAAAPASTRPAPTPPRTAEPAPYNPAGIKF